MVSFQFVIVLYKTDILQSVSYQSMLMGKKDISLLIYDNSPISSSSHDKLDPAWNTVYHHDPLNSGLSAAYNLGAEIAQQSAKSHLILLDQDTTFPSGILDQYEDSITKFEGIGLFSPILKMNNGLVMSPCRYKNHRGKAIESINPGLHSLDRYMPVNSGLCISVNSFFSAGGYNVKVKVDGADFQFLERYKTIDKRFVVMDAICTQDFSAFDPNFESVMKRFVIYQNDVSNYEVRGWRDKYYHARNLFIRMAYLTIQHKTLAFFKQYLKKI